jgi:hypothetical protein
MNLYDTVKFKHGPAISVAWTLQNESVSLVSRVKSHVFLNPRVVPIVDIVVPATEREASTQISNSENWMESNN